MSSAIFNILLVTSSSKSLMHIKNKINPSVDPCGTHSKLLAIHCFIQLILLFPTPRDFNLSISVLVFDQDEHGSKRYDQIKRAAARRDIHGIFAACSSGHDNE